MTLEQELQFWEAIVECEARASRKLGFRRARLLAAKARDLKYFRDYPSEGVPYWLYLPIN